MRLKARVARRLKSEPPAVAGGPYLINAATASGEAVRLPLKGAFAFRFKSEPPAVVGGPYLINAATASGEASPLPQAVLTLIGTPASKPL